MPAARDRRWEILNSWWILTTFFVVLSWVGFLYIGLRAREGKWIRWSFFYMIPPALLGIVIWMNLRDDAMTTTTGALSVSILLIWVLSVMHALLVRREFLSLLAEYEDNPEREVTVKREVHMYYVPADQVEQPEAAEAAEAPDDEAPPPTIPDTPGRQVDY